MSGAMQAKARQRWPGETPAWVLELAAVVDREGLKGASKRVGYSGPTISQVLSNTYPTSVEPIAERVRGALMGETVICPVKDAMTRDICLSWQAKPFSTSSSDRARMYRACRSGCPHSKHTKGADHD